MKRSLKIFAVLWVLFYAMTMYAAVTVTVNGSNHTIPQTNEKGWGNNVTAWIQAISANTLQPSGGTFTLTSDVNFGGSFGLVSTYFKSRTSGISTAGILRLANSDAIGWRNSGGAGNLLLQPGGSDGLLQYNSVDLVGTSLTQTLTNKTIDGDGNTVQDLPITAIKTVAGDADEFLIRDGSGVPTSGKTVPTGDVVGSSDTQTLTNKTMAIGSNTITGSANHVAIVNGSGTVTTEAQLAVSRGGTNLGSYTAGDILYATGATTLAKLGIGSAGQVLKVSGSAPAWAGATASLSVATKTAAYTLTTSDDAILGDVSGGAFTLTLPTAVGNTGKVFYIKKISDDATALTIDGDGSETIDGETSIELTIYNGSVTLASDGTNWLIIDRNYANARVLTASVDTTSGTAHDFTGIPAWVKRITINFAGVGLSGTDALLVQIGDSGGIHTTGYVSSSTQVDAQSTSTSGFVVRGGIAAETVSGIMVLTLISSTNNNWASMHGVSRTSAAQAGGGINTGLDSALTQVRITRTGTNTFDAGHASIIYE